MMASLKQQRSLLRLRRVVADDDDDDTLCHPENHTNNHDNSFPFLEGEHQLHPLPTRLIGKMKSNKRLDFDSCSEEDMPRSSSPERDNRKKLLFDYTDDEPFFDFGLSDPPSSPPPPPLPPPLPPFKSKVVSLANAGLSPIEPRRMESPRNHHQLSTALLELKDLNDSSADSSLDKFSPCRTRSGRIYTSVEKKKQAGLSLNKSAKSNPSSSASKLPTPVFLDLPRSSSRHNSGASLGFATPRCTRIRTSHLRPQALELRLLQRDVSGEAMDVDDDDEQAPAEPPPLNHVKRPVSRLHVFAPESPPVPGTPLGLHSPPTSEVRALRLFDRSPSAATASLGPGHPPPLPFGDRDWHRRRVSAPPAGAGLRVSFERSEAAESAGKERKRKRVANVNPFTPTSMMASIKKKFRSEPKLNLLGTSYGSHQVDKDGFQNGPHQPVAASVEPDLEINPAKRLRVSDINISRYEEEFVELKEIASGSFGKVKVARHCLDGMLYAIKVTSNKIYCNTHEERVAMNEVFAHSSLMKHKHVVRYYNSWVENGHVYIQNEYCEGGSLANLIKSYRKKGIRFTECELKRILLHIAKGLQYIHSKQLVHLDIKPENILIALDHLTPSPQIAKPIEDGQMSLPNGDIIVSQKSCRQQESSGEAGPLRAVLEHGDCSGNESTDSGHASGCDGRGALQHHMSEGVDQRISYKIGDLGHVVPIYGENIPEEGDCRYMAPELLTYDIDREKLPMADIFSLGLTLYEAASLQELPKNSIDDPMYERLKAGNLPFIEGYSKEFNQILKSMVSKDENARPSAMKIVTHGYLRSSSMSKSRAQLYKELKETKARLKMLEVELSCQKDRSVLNAQGPGWNVPINSRPLPDNSSSPLSSPVKATALLTLAERPVKKIPVGRGSTRSRSCMM